MRPRSKITVRWCFGVLLLGFVLTGAVGCERDGPQIVWRFAIEETAGSVQDAYAQRFAELVEERSGGRIDVIVYPYGTLGTSDQITEQLYTNTIQFAMASPGHLGKMIPEVQVFLLHFVFSEDAEVNNRLLLDNPELRELFEELYRQKGMELLTVFSEGWMAWTTNVPIEKPEDFDGMKMRVMTTPLLLAAYEAYDASATPLPYSEVYSGLQLKMIDGQVNPVFAIEEMSFYEVTDHMIFPRHAQFFTSMVTSSVFFEETSDEDKELLRGVVRDLQPEILEIQRDYNRERLDKIRERKPELTITELTPEQREAFRERSLPVRKEFVELAGARGQEVLDMVLEAVQKGEAARQKAPKP